VNRALQTISECNQVLVRAAEESDLLRDICKILVGSGGYRMAWVGFAENDEGKSVRPVAHSGFEEEYLQAANITWADTERGRGPTGTAIRTRKPSVARFIHQDPSLASWREEALKRGYASSTALPILVNDQTLGVITIYAQEADAFDSAEMLLLAELSDDLAYGIQALRTRTERGRAESAIRESEERYRTLFERNLAGVLVTSWSGDILNCNPSMANILGFASPHEACGRRVLDLYFSPEERDGFLKRLEAEGRLTNFEMHLRRRDGNPVWLMGNINLQPQGANGLRIIEAVFVDITERKLAEAENVRLAAIVNSSDDAIFSASREGLITSWNAGAERMYGYAAEEIRGKQISVLIPEDRRGDLAANQEKLFRGEALVHYEFEHLRKDGSRLQVSETLSPIRDAAGFVTGVSVIARDATERKQAEQALRQSESTLRNVFKAVPVGICIMKDRVFQSGNDLWYEVIGYTEAELVGQTPRRFYETEEEYQRVGRELYTDLPKRGVVSVETRLRRGDGTFRDIILTATLLNPSDPSAGEMVAIRDVTEPKQMEEALRESEQKYRELVQYANSIILRWTRDGRVLFLNEFGQRFFGYTEAEIRGRHVIGTLVPETESSGRRLPPIMDEIFANPAAFEQVVNENMRRNGERVWIAWTNKVVLNQQGQAAEILSIGTDITARKQAEEALRAREIQLRLIHDNSYDVMFAIGVEPQDQFRFISVNHKFMEVTGLQEEQVVGKLVQEIIPEPARSFVVGKYYEAIQTRHPVHWEEVSDYPAGRKTGAVTVAPVFDAGGKCTQLIGTVHDITERKQAEEALRRNEEQLRLIMENLADLVAVLDLDGHRIYNSPSYGGILGTPDRLRGTSSFVEIHPEDRARVQQAFQDTVRTGRGQRLEYRLLDQNGIPRHIESQGSVIRDDDGKVAQVLVVSRDVTERRQAVEAIRELNASLERRVMERTAELAVARDRAEMADRTKSAFLATMSHELRTPLNSIIGFTGLLLQSLAGPLNAEQAKQLGMVKESGQHLLALINDVLDISKIEAGQIEIANAPFDLPASMQKVVQTVTPLANKKQLPLIVQIAPGVGQITSDRRRVEQILLNLLSNAIKFTERGEVTLSAEITPGTPHVPHPAVRISVADTGMGIKGENLDKLFQPFRQLDTGLTRQHEGTGLGLAICKRLVERMGGTIAVESEWSKGSTFQCTLPIHPERKS
jgi:PAS domain S-box-containing protein